MKIEYKVLEFNQKDGGERPLAGPYGISEKAWLQCQHIGIHFLIQMVKAAAGDYYNKHDGWKDGWPLTFEIYIDGKKQMVFRVDREDVPTFIATAREG